MEHDNIYMLMMDALDGELAAAGHMELEAHLRACPSCLREWQALLAIDTLFRQTPALSPPAGFTQRTLARLPNQKHRIWVMSALYMVLLLGGLLPILTGVWAVSQWGTVIKQPTIITSLLQTTGHVLEVIGAVFSALLSNLGEFVVQQPAILGWLWVMAGIVVLWGGVYREIVRRPEIMVTY